MAETPVEAPMQTMRAEEEEEAKVTSKEELDGGKEESSDGAVDEQQPEEEDDVPLQFSTSGSSASNAKDKDEQAANDEVEESAHAVEAPVTPSKKASEKEDRDPTVRVWYATNRKMNEKGVYTTNHDTQNTYGHMDIELKIAQNHSPPPKRNTARMQYVKKTEDAFFNEIRGSLDYYRDLGCAPQALVCFHNYNVDFIGSIVGAAHWHEDLNVPGSTISYSWPAVGKSGNYEPDSAAMERSEPEILDFLIKLSQLCGSEHVHLLADGCACYGLLRVLQRMAGDQRIENLQLGQIFLLAPDVDQELFIDLSYLFPKYSTRTTMYVSKVDRDAKRSVKRHQAPRAGVFPPYTIVEGIDTIAIASLETDDFHNEKKTLSYEIVSLCYDMYDLMKSNAPPRRRLHLAHQVDDGKTFWKLRKL